MDISEPNKILLRDCKAVKIPEGITGVLKKGHEVTITQALGGSLTVEYNGNLYKIKPEDCDAVLESFVILTPAHLINRMQIKRQQLMMFGRYYEPVTILKSQ